MNHPATSPVLFTIADVNRMIDAGVFEHRTERIELIEGEFRMMSPASNEHDALIRYLTNWSVQTAGDEFLIAVQQGIELIKTESMPEPDLCWVPISHGRSRPTPPMIPLVIEVSLSSLEYDLTDKQRLYAMEGIPEYWVVDPESETIIVHVQPLEERYASATTFSIGQTLSPACIPAGKLDLKWLFRD